MAVGNGLPLSKGPIPTPRGAATQTPPVRVKAPVVDPMVAQAIGQARTSILPQVQSVAAERAAAATRAEQEQASTEQAFKALSGILKGISPTVGNAYRTAGIDQAMFAKGFTDGLAHLQSQAGAQTSERLGAGTPQAQAAGAAVGGTGAQNALYALGGYIPASTLNREGAAFQAAAAQLPGTAAGQGLQQVQALAAKQALTDAGFDAREAGLMARIPGLAQTALDHLRSAKATQDYRAAGLAQGDRRIDENIAHDKALEKAAEESRVALAKYEAGRLTISQFNAETSRINAKLSAAKAEAARQPKYNASISRSLGFRADQYGNPMGGKVTLLPGFAPGKDGAPVKVGTASSKTPKPKVLTPRQAQVATANAFTAVQHMFDGATVPKTGEVLPPLSREEALAELEKQGYFVTPQLAKFANKALLKIYGPPVIHSGGEFGIQAQAVP